MRRTTTALLAALALVLALLAGCAEQDGAPAGGATEPLPAPLPELELGGFAGGEPAQLADLRGPMVVNLWASWCGPCREEMPVLEEFHRKYRDRVAMVGIDFLDPQVERAERLADETGVTYPLYTDLGGDLDRLGPFPHLRALPFLAFVDEQGEVVGWEFVAIDDLAELESLVEQHLGEA